MESHEHLEHDLAAYVAGRLDEADRLRIESHLRDCESCASMVSNIDLLAQGIREGGAGLFAPHPDPASIRVFALDAADPHVAKHVASCATCALEVSSWRSRAAPTQRTGSVVALAVAALLIIGIGLGFVVGTLVEQGTPGFSVEPGQGGQIIALRTLRNHESGTTVRIAADDSFATLALPLVIPVDASDAEPVRYEMERNGGPVVWSWDTTAGRIRELERDSEMAAFPISTEILGPGRYTVRAVFAAHSPRRVLLETHFDVASPE